MSNAQHTPYRQDCNWLVKEAGIARATLNKIRRAKCGTFEEKLMASIEVSKMDYAEVCAALKQEAA